MLEWSLKSHTRIAKETGKAMNFDEGAAQAKYASRDFMSTSLTRPILRMLIRVLMFALVQLFRRGIRYFHNDS